MTSSWRRNPTTRCRPAARSSAGTNMAFQKSEAELNGFDEVVVLYDRRARQRGSAANLFMVRDGVAFTPPVSDDLLEG